MVVRISVRGQHQHALQALHHARCARARALAQARQQARAGAARTGGAERRHDLVAREDELERQLLALAECVLRRARHSNPTLQSVMGTTR